MSEEAESFQRLLGAAGGIVGVAVLWWLFVIGRGYLGGGGSGDDDESRIPIWFALGIVVVAVFGMWLVEVISDLLG